MIRQNSKSGGSDPPKCFFAKNDCSARNSGGPWVRRTDSHLSPPPLLSEFCHHQAARTDCLLVALLLEKNIGYQAFTSSQTLQQHKQVQKRGKRKETSSQRLLLCAPPLSRRSHLSCDGRTGRQTSQRRLTLLTSLTERNWAAWELNPGPHFQ